MASNNSDVSLQRITAFPLHGKAITPSGSDLTDYDGVVRPMTVFAGTGGSVVVEPAGDVGQSVTVVVPDGGVIPFRVRKVTSVVGAADLVGVW